VRHERLVRLEAHVVDLAAFQFVPEGRVVHPLRAAGGREGDARFRLLRAQESRAEAAALRGVNQL
jgi:hypothetical protein